MKRVLYCVLLFVAASVACLLAGYGITRYYVRQERALPNTVMETETVRDMEGRAVAAREQIQPVVETAEDVCQAL